MQCPTCPTLLSRLSVGALELDECPRCMGMWFDKGELQELLSNVVAAKALPQRFVPPDAVKAVVRANCPRCITARLVPQEEHGQSVAGCGNCGGRWLPAELLSALLPAEPTPPPPAKIAQPPRPEVSSGPTAAALASAAPMAPAASPAAPSPAVRAEAEAEPPAVAPPPSPQPVQHAHPAAPPMGACTACGGYLDDVSHEGQSFHRCAKCGGLFFSRGGLPFFLGNKPSTWPLPKAGGAVPGDRAKCAACGYAMEPMDWQGRGARVHACTHCWSTFVGADSVRHLVAPEKYMEDPIDGAALFIWRVFDRVTEYLLKPPPKRSL